MRKDAPKVLEVRRDVVRTFRITTSVKTGALASQPCTGGCSRTELPGAVP